FFFFQAEDGIRDRNVTGVQTCALPISPQPDRRPRCERAKCTCPDISQLPCTSRLALQSWHKYRAHRSETSRCPARPLPSRAAQRSEERRVGKECSSWMGRDS